MRRLRHGDADERADRRDRREHPAAAVGGGESDARRRQPDLAAPQRVLLWAAASAGTCRSRAGPAISRPTRASTNCAISSIGRCGSAITPAWRSMRLRRPPRPRRRRLRRRRRRPAHTLSGQGGVRPLHGHWSAKAFHPDSHGPGLDQLRRHLSLDGPHGDLCHACHAPVPLDGSGPGGLRPGDRHRDLSDRHQDGGRYRHLAGYPARS